MTGGITCCPGHRQEHPCDAPPRRCIAGKREQLATGERYWLYLIWQEDWTTNPFARSKYVKGQIVYQKDPNAAAYYARPFAYRDGVLSVPADARLEEAVPTVLPPDRIKLNLVDL